MPYLSTRRLHGIANRKVDRNMMYRKAKRMCSAISRGLESLENRYLRSRARA